MSSDNNINLSPLYAALILNSEQNDTQADNEKFQTIFGDALALARNQRTNAGEDGVVSAAEQQEVDALRNNKDALPSQVFEALNNITVA